MEIPYPQLKFTGSVNIDYLKKHANELKQLQKEGYQVDEKDLEHISPASF